MLPPLFCKEVISEYQEVLSRAKFRFDEQEVNRFIERIIDLGEELDISNIYVNLVDNNDIPFYKSFINKRNNNDLVFLVTGNKKHYPVDPFILSPREFYDLIENIKYFSSRC